MEIVRNYKPTARALKFHSTTARFIVLVGGQGCMREDSLVETIEGPKAFGEITTPQLYRSWDGESFVHSVGTAPFPKGKGMLYRVVHERGEFFASEEHLTLSSDGEYRPVRQLGPSIFSAHLPTNEESSLSGLIGDVRHSFERAVDCLDGYLTCFRPHGLQPLLSGGVDLASPPLRAYAPGSLRGVLSELSSRLDALPGLGRGCNHRYPQSSPRPTYGFSRQVEDLASVVEDCISASSSGCTSGAHLESRRSRMMTALRRIKELLASVFHSFEETYSQSAVLAIEKTEEDWYFDIQVGNTNNYVSGGAVHHNSGKSRALIEELVQSGIDYPGYPMAVYRKTLPSLRDSTLHEYRMLVPEGIGKMHETILSYNFLNDSFINFRGLDDPNKAKSTNYATIVMEEADEFTYDDFKFLNGRIRAAGKWPLRIILLLNPVDETHWIYKTFVTNAEEMDRAGRISNGNTGPGLLVEHFSTYDNRENLPAGYIESMTAGMSPDEIDRYVHGKWGTILKGTPVYGKLMMPDLHLRTVNFDSSMRVVRGWDFGFNHPACVWRVIDQYGRKNINHEMVGEKEDLETFARRVIEATKHRYGEAPVLDFCDPHGHDKKDNAQSSVETLRELGIWAEGERGVRDYVEPGIALIRKELSTLIEGVPELTIDPRCTIMRAAYFGKYVRDEDGKPKKDGFYDHPCDADRYIAYNHKSNSVVKDLILSRKNRVRPARNRYTGY